MGWKECTTERVKVCNREEDKGYNKCTEERDEGYSQCTETRDDGYRNCCTWWPCSWACKAWVWVSNIVCVVWTWISNIVCVVWTWIKHIVCVAWVYITVIICLIPGVGKYIADFLDALLQTVLGIIGGIIEGIIDFITNPIESLGTIISLFGGCPSVRATEILPLQIIAHHGATQELPENTTQSCERAIQLGANALEVDVCMTADEQLILWHDWDPDSLISITRQTEIAQSDNAFKPKVPKLGDEWRKPTIELSLEQFRRHFSYEDMRDPAVRIKDGVTYGKVDLTIPTLDEFIEAIVTSTTSTWRGLRTVYLDIKMPGSSALRYAGLMTEKIYKLLSHERLADIRFILMVPDILVLRVMEGRSQEKNYNLVFTWDVEFPVGLILNPSKYSAINHATSSLFHNSVASVGRPVASLFPWKIYRRTIEYDIKQWNKVNYEPGRFNSGIKITDLIAWTIDDYDEMKCLAKMGVSGIITDDIQTLVDVAAATGR